ncbi:MAG TPA: hypothetical protein VF905_04190 [Nitrospirota bacterium]
MFGPPDLDNIDPYPANGTLEEKAQYGLEQLRTNFYWQKRTYMANKEGGARYSATLLAHGPKTAERMAKMAEMHFKGYLSQAYLTPEGETTDAKYPVDKMINSELRRIRQVIVLSVANFMYYFESMMPEQLDDWNTGMIHFNLDSYRHRYVSETYEDINVVIPQKKLPPRSAYELEEYIGDLARKWGTKDERAGLTKNFIVGRIRDSVIEFLLVDIPFNNKRLEEGTKLIADEVKPAEADEKPVLH